MRTTVGRSRGPCHGQHAVIWDIALHDDDDVRALGGQLVHLEAGRVVGRCGSGSGTDSA